MLKIPDFTLQGGSLSLTCNQYTGPSTECRRPLLHTLAGQGQCLACVSAVQSARVSQRRGKNVSSGHMKPLSAAPASHSAVHSSLSCSASGLAPCQYAWQSGKGWPEFWGPGTHVGDPDGSWFWPSTAPAFATLSATAPHTHSPRTAFQIGKNKTMKEVLMCSFLKIRFLQIYCTNNKKTDLSVFKVYLTGKGDRKMRPRESVLNICRLTPKWLHQPFQAKARSSWISHGGTRIQVLEPFSIAFPCPLVGSWTRSEAAGT